MDSINQENLDPRDVDSLFDEIATESTPNIATSSTHNPKCPYIVAGTWELSRILRTSILTLPLRRPNDEDSLGWSLTICNDIDVPTYAKEVTCGEQDYPLAIELHTQYLPPACSKLVCLPAAAVKMIHFRSEDEMDKIKSQYAAFADIDLALVEYQASPDLFDGESRETSQEHNQADSFELEHAIQGLSLGQVLATAHSISAQNTLTEAYPCQLDLLKIYEAIDGKPHDTDPILDLVSALAQPLSKKPKTLGAAFAHAVVELQGATQPGPTAIFEKLAPLIKSLPNNVVKKSNLEFLEQVARQERLVEPSRLTDERNGKSRDLFPLALTLLLSDASYKRLLKFNSVMPQDRPGPKVLFCAQLMAASLRAGSSLPDIEWATNSISASVTSKQNVKLDHSLRIAIALARIAGANDQAEFIAKQTDDVKLVSTPSRRGHVRHYLEGSSLDESSSADRAVLVAWEEHDESWPILDEIYRRACNTLNSCEPETEVTVCSDTMRIEIRSTCLATSPSPVWILVGNQPDRLTVRFESKIDLDEIRGKVRQNAEFVVGLLKLCSSISCGFSANTDGPKTRPITGLTFFANQLYSTLDQEEILFHLSSVREACSKVTNAIKDSV